MSYQAVSHCGNDHQQWIKSIDFYKDDIKTLQTRLAEVATRNSAKEVLARVEHFQNQFIVQRNNIDELKHRIHEHDGKVAKDVFQHVGKIESAQVSEHDRIKAEVEGFEKVVNDLRKEFNEFLVKWM